MAYPVTFDVTRPEKYERPQVLIRIVVYFVFGFVISALYLALPVLAAIWTSQKGSEKFLAEDGPKIKGWLRWAVAGLAYVYMLTDKFPSGDEPEGVMFDIQMSGSPSVGSALLRLITSIPSAIVVGILGYISAVIWIIAAVQILMQENYSEGLFNFQRGVVRWQARLYGYHSSLVDEYPPFALDTGPEGPSAPAA